MSQSQVLQTTSKPHRSLDFSFIFDITAIFFIAGLTLYLRARYIAHYNPWVDEYSTMLAAKMITQKSLPVFPSGLLYEHGILYSYLAALAAWLFGFSEASMRLPSLFAAVLTVPLLYIVGRRCFSRSVGLLAIIPFATMSDILIWGGRARMYSLLMLFVLLTVYFAFQSTQTPARHRYYLLTLIFLALAMLTHFNTVLMVIPLLIAILAVEYVGRPNFSLKSFLGQVWPALAGILVIVGGSVLLKRLGRPKGANVYDPSSVETGLEALTDPIRVISRAYIDLKFGWDEGLGHFVLYFTESDWLPLTLLFGLGVVIVAIDLISRRRSLNKSQRALMFLCLIWGLSFLEMVTVVSSDRRDPKYLTMLFPLLALIGAASFVRLLHWSLDRVQVLWPATRPLRLRAVFLAGSILLLLMLYLPGALRIFTGQELGYNHTLHYVSDHLQPGDMVLTSLTSACALYLDGCDYFATQFPAKRRMLETPEGTIVDRWAGAMYLTDATAFETLLRQEQRVWLITDRWRLEAYYDAPFRNLIFSQMENIKTSQDSMVFLKNGPFLEITPTFNVNAYLGEQLELWGYDLETDSFRPNDQIHLNLLWRAVTQPAQNYTIFVHLRDENNANVAQADFQPFDGSFPTSAWREGETVQLPVNIQLPAAIQPGTYHIVIGMYLLETMERLPVNPDQSGENAVILHAIKVS